MAKKSVVNRNLKRQEMVKKFRSVRAELKEAAFGQKNSPKTRAEAFARLQKLPRDSSLVRIRNRCFLTGRPRGVFRRFGMSRTILREIVMNGEIPGVTKSSW